ncbi:hypothetical protein IE53DRAFT_219322 [Violaceomyces palustris]|uniref:Uncharacterized protein n=1 Tax=Violaceomyces palustris TaxID=1673888 RepID=A0ACD0P4P4_9BASI|nr:hypothetical protein IE53DRAFT_219322 [Violaceomyces palustris]
MTGDNESSSASTLGLFLANHNTPEVDDSDVQASPGLSASGSASPVSSDGLDGPSQADSIGLCLDPSLASSTGMAPLQLPQAMESSTDTLQDGSHLWSSGMRNVLGSLIGLPPSKTTVPSKAPSVKGNPISAADMEAYSSIWDIPGDMIAMTMGYSDSYEEQSSFAQPVWAPSISSYSNEESSSSQTYPPPSAISGLPVADAPRTRVNPEFQLEHEPRPYMRRATYQPHARSATSDASFSRPPPPLESFQGDSLGPPPPRYSHGGESSHTWWSSTHEQTASGGDSRGLLSLPSSTPDSGRGASTEHGNRSHDSRPNGRPDYVGNASSSLGFDIGSYEFPSNSLGKRSYEEVSSNDSNGVNDGADSALRRYSLAPNMVFSRQSATTPASLLNYRPPSDPRRQSLGVEPAYFYQQIPPPPSRFPAPGVQQSAWPSWLGQNPASAASMGASATATATPSPHDSPAINSWKDTVKRSNNTSPPTSSTSSHRRQSSAASQAIQSNLLATTPYHITTDIVLRAPPGSKMEDVYYDQHCENQTGMPDPPASDFDVANEDDKPRLQTDKLRFAGDLYTPRWVRGTGNAREAWCDRCEHGNWLQLKNSQYWYDQVHKHGISSVSGLRFTAPTHLRVYADAAGTVEGKCHQCGEWILICTAKRRRNFAAFFKHAHSCHSYRKASAVGNGPIVEHTAKRAKNGE